MPELLDAIAGWPVAEWLRFSRYGYATLSAIHILGFATLFGAIVAHDLAVLGLYPRKPQATHATNMDAVQSPSPLLTVAASGLALALTSGFLLFSVRPHGYIGNPVFVTKLIVLAVAILNVIVARLLSQRHDHPIRWARRTALVSLVCWITMILLGRLIAFTGD